MSAERSRNNEHDTGTAIVKDADEFVCRVKYDIYALDLFGQIQTVGTNESMSGQNKHASTSLTVRESVSVINYLKNDNLTLHLENGLVWKIKLKTRSTNRVWQVTLSGFDHQLYSIDIGANITGLKIGAIGDVRQQPVDSPPDIPPGPDDPILKYGDKRPRNRR